MRINVSRELNCHILENCLYTLVMQNRTYLIQVINTNNITNTLK